MIAVVEVPVTVSAEFGRAQRLEEVLKLVQAKVPAAQRNTLAAFVQRYYGQVDPEDLAERGSRRSVRRRAVALEFRPPGAIRRTPASASSIHRSRSTAGSRRTRSSRS